MDEEFPVAPGGNTPESSPTGGSATLSGRICVSMSLVDLRSCRSSNLAGYRVQLGDQSATTDIGGNFTMDSPTGAPGSFTISGSGAVTTTTPYTASFGTLPVIDADVYARALASNQIFGSAGTGAILGNITRGGSPASNLTVTSDPRGAYSPLYDAEGTGFAGNATGARGVFWLPGIAAGTTNLRFSDAAGGETTVAGVQVVNGGVTILDSLVMP